MIYFLNAIMYRDGKKHCIIQLYYTYAALIASLENRLASRTCVQRRFFIFPMNLQ